MRALVTGATGFIGRRLIGRLSGPVVLSRDAERARKTLGEVDAFSWNPESGPPPADAFREVDVVFNLAGDPVAEGRWTAAKKQNIRNSRVLGTRNLVHAFESLERRPKVLVSGSAVGYYGDRGDEELDESSAPGKDFLAGVCQAWESEALKATELGVRVVVIRTGIVLGADGGALPKMLTPFRMGVGGRLGTGRQWMPWIHAGDLVSLLLFAAEHGDVSGPINGTAPEPVTNAEFTRVLGRVLRRPTVFPAPAVALRLMFGAEKADMLLASQRALPRAAVKAQFQFAHVSLDPALRAVLA